MFKNNKNEGSGFQKSFGAAMFFAAIGVFITIFATDKLSKKANISTSNADTAQKAKDGFAANQSI
jgi:uncharacterized membrane protein